MFENYVYNLRMNFVMSIVNHVLMRKEIGGKICGWDGWCKLGYGMLKWALVT